MQMEPYGQKRIVERIVDQQRSTVGKLETNQMILKIWSYGLLVAAALFLLSTAPAGAANTGSATATCGADLVISYSPTILSPPNHKLVPISISAVDTDLDGDFFDVTVTSITSSQTEGSGEGCGQPTGKQEPDFTGVGNTASPSDPSTPAVLTGVSVRAERCAREGARVYDIQITCSEGADEATNATTDLFITVPKSHRVTSK